MNTRRLCALAASTIATILLAPGIAAPAEAVSAVRIEAVQYDSPGSDFGGNLSLNAEWIRITNYSSTKKVLTGWTLRDTANHVYRFGTFTLGAGKSVRIHTGKGRNSATDRYWGQGWYVWNNDGDRATLRTGSGGLVSSRSW